MATALSFSAIVDGYSNRKASLYYLPITRNPPVWQVNPPPHCWETAGCLAVHYYLIRNSPRVTCQVVLGLLHQQQDYFVLLSKVSFVLHAKA